MIEVEYSSNNSGGNWWLEDKDWLNLEREGWHVIWGGHYFCSDQDSSYYFEKIRSNGKHFPCENKEKCKGHRMFESFSEMNDNDRFIGCAASYATKSFHSLEEAVAEWERITGQDPEEEGCPCCGTPHSFSAREKL